jgi:hypothetical protein
MKKELKKEFSKLKKLKIIGDFNTKHHRYLVVQCEADFNYQEAYHLAFLEHSKLEMDENKYTIIRTAQKFLESPTGRTAIPFNCSSFGDRRIPVTPQTTNCPTCGKGIFQQTNRSIPGH